ncbi:toxin-antitoxin system YwqK family antitoxin [Aquimarina algicola]|uniref:Toxin-antitoxin system YwqK family antitoxin n=1 Tax=Aquimarina algicola TaxID=2589995 RepID=A0A504IZU1_9FLAO|nr:hypothetical protein [Aquimarina algicola]TPN80963.1 hypothetical protein FHK87_25935 [Aquimarina algicola]
MRLKIITFLYIVALSVLNAQQKVVKPAVLSSNLKIEKQNENGLVIHKKRDAKILLEGRYEILIQKLDSSHNNVSLFGGINTGFVEEGTFEKGLKDGFWKTNYKNKIVKKEHWNNGLISNEYSVYNTKGKLLYQVDFGAKGNGKYKDFYYNTGILKQEGGYENGKKEGEWCTYDEKGKLVSTLLYDDGKAQNP